jgi:hypothetical protein
LKGQSQTGVREERAVPIEQQPPEVLALLIADHVHWDDSSGKCFILGTRSSISAATFPCNRSGLAVYAAMTDGRGETALKIRLVDVDEVREPVMEFETTLNFLDPTEDVEVAFLLTELVFPEPGDYRLQLYGAGQLLRERRFLVIPLENPSNP